MALGTEWTTCSKCGRTPPEVVSFSMLEGGAVCHLCVPPEEVDGESAVSRFGRVSYQKGLIDAAKDICVGCEEAGRPSRKARIGKVSISHPTGEGKWMHGLCVCQAQAILDRLEASGDWLLVWPEYSSHTK